MRSRWRCTSSPRFATWHIALRMGSSAPNSASRLIVNIDDMGGSCSACLLLATLTAVLLSLRQKRQTRDKERWHWQRPDVAASLLKRRARRRRRLCCSAEHIISDPDSCTTTEAWTDAHSAGARYFAGGPQEVPATGTVAPAAGAPAPAAASRCHARSQQSNLFPCSMLGQRAEPSEFCARE